MLNMRSLIQEHMGFLVKLSICLIFSLAIIGGCSYLNRQVGLKDDHPLEEIIEDQLHEQLGLDLDLSPESQE